MLNLECTYLDATKKRGPPKGYIELIENRLKKLKMLVREISRHDSNIAELIRRRASQLDRSSAQDGACDGDDSDDDEGLQQQPKGLHISFSELLDDIGLDQGLVDPAITAGAPKVTDSDGIYRDQTYCRQDRASPTNEDAAYLSLRHRPSDPQSITAQRDKDAIAWDEDESPIWMGDHEPGHLTIDETGALRYLGDTSGWYLFSQNMARSSEDSRLKRISGQL
ncbi:hypothetical protein EV182_005485, partial [Spiromyces aspiralis]